ncbi:MAG: 2-amino-4-hydroxy-6-hydroxymethyldihydropteridine diphosphokinase [Deinococcales bacterium]
MLLSDKIVLKGAEFYARHGFYEAEASLGSRFIVDVELSLNLPADDDLSHSVSYADIYDLIRHEVTETRHKLIESLANRMAERILEAHPLVEGLTLRVHKPFAPLAGIFRDVYVEVSRQRETLHRPLVLIALGSNLDEPYQQLLAAYYALEHLGDILKASPIYQSASMGGPSGQPDYLNAVIALETSLEPDELLRVLLAIEAARGRKRQVRWEARTLDLDLLAYGDRVMEYEGLSLPHPRMLERPFVLLPLHDIYPNWQHPKRQQSLETSLNQLHQQDLATIKKTQLSWPKL